MKRKFVFSHLTARKLAAAYCMTAPDGYVCTIEPSKKSRLQEEKYHAMIRDISRSCKFMGRTWSAEDWKRLLIAAFVTVMRQLAEQEGKPDPFEGMGQIVPSLVGDGFVQLGVPSKGFTKPLAALFIEYLYAYGTEHGAVWTEVDE